VAGERTRLLRFAAVGLLGCVIQLGVFALAVGPVGWNHLIAAASATALALCSNFVLNRLWTFDAAHLHMGAQAWKFAVVSAVAIGVNVLVVLILVDGLGMAKGLGEVIAVGFQAPVSYLGNRLWTFATPAGNDVAVGDAHYSSPA
jgi:dolichol-phosphate mannosyltransferase